jgi:AcrR family transcriptional regulator
MMTPSTDRRPPLTRDRLLTEAMALADEAGLAAVTMRALAARLGVAPMAAYHHVAGKGALLDGLVDRVFAEMELPVPGRGWRAELARRCTSARAVLRRHPWALGLLDSRRSPGPQNLRHHEAVIATLRAAGFSVAASAQAYALLDAFVYGFVLQETSLPMQPGEDVADVARDIVEAMGSEEYPALTEMAMTHSLRPGYDFGDEFAPNLQLVLDSVERLARSPGSPDPTGAAPGLITTVAAGTSRSARPPRGSSAPAGRR